jgi:hypothetical protein
MRAMELRGARALACLPGWKSYNSHAVLTRRQGTPDGACPWQSRTFLYATPVSGVDDVRNKQPRHGFSGQRRVELKLSSTQLLVLQETVQTLATVQTPFRQSRCVQVDA